MAAKKRKRKFYIFYPVYLMCVLACVWGIFVICQNITDELTIYEASLPKYVAEDFAEMFINRDFERIYSYQDPGQFVGEDASTYSAYLEELTKDGELTWSESYSSNEDEKVYVVLLDGKRLFEFRLTRGGEKDANGYDTWSLSKVSTLGISTTTRTVKAPSDSTVYVRGEALGEESIIERGIAVEEEDYLLNDQARSPEMCVWQYEVCFTEPEVRAVDAKGREHELTIDEAGNAEAAMNSDDEIKAAAEERVGEIVRAFANFTSEDLSKYKMLKFVRKGTNGYEKIEDFDNNWFGKHDGFEFGEIVTDNYISFSEDTFACDIRFEYIIQYDDADDIVYPTAYRFYFVFRNETWYLYDFKMLIE